MVNRRLPINILYLPIFLIAVCPQRALAQDQPRTSDTSIYHVGVTLLDRAAHKPTPFELGQGIVVFRAQVAGKEVWAMLDNLASQTTVDIDFARSADVTIFEPIDTIKTPNGSLESRRTAPVEILVPGQLVARGPVSVADLKPFGKIVGRPIVLILGKEYFDNLSFLIKPTGTFEIGYSGALNIPAGAPAIPLLDGRYRVTANINGVDVMLAVDLGSNGAVKLTTKTWPSVAARGRNFRTVDVAGADGKPVREPLVAIPNVQIGPIKLGEVDVQAGSTNGNEGLLGMAILSRFTIAIDGKAAKLWLIPTQIAGPTRPTP